MIAIALLGVLGAPALVYISAPGFADEPAKFDATVLLTRITFPYICFISLVRCPPAFSTPGAGFPSLPSRRCCSMWR